MYEGQLSCNIEREEHKTGGLYGVLKEHVPTVKTISLKIVM